MFESADEAVVSRVIRNDKHVIVISKHFCFILSMGTRIRLDCVMRRRFSSRGHNTSASVTVTSATGLHARSLQNTVELETTATYQATNFQDD